MSDKPEFFVCDCYSHAVGVSDDGEDFVFLTFWEYAPSRRIGWSERLSRAWGWLIGRPRVTSEMVLRAGEAGRLAEAITERATAIRLNAEF